MTDWGEKTLGELCNLITDGKHGDCRNEGNSGYYFISCKDVRDGRILYENARQIVQADFAETHRRTDLKSGDILLTNSGTIGRLAIAPDDERTQRTTFQKSVAILKPIHQTVSSQFLYYSLAANRTKLINAAGGAAQKNLLLGELRRFPVRLPPVAVQKGVACILSAYDDLIENNRRRIELLEQAARLLYKEWFVHLRFPSHEHVKIKGGIPEGWKMRPLYRCAKFLSGGTPSKARSDFWDGDIPWVSSGELKAMRIHRTKLNVTPEAVASGSRIVPPETILAVVRGMSLAKEFRIGITAKAVSFNQDLKAIASEPDIDTLFLFHSLDAQRNQIRDRASDASHGTKKLDTPVLSEVPIAVPPPTIQALFRQHVYSLHAQWDNLDIQNEKLRVARDLLLPRLMNGEITV